MSSINHRKKHSNTSRKVNAMRMTQLPTEVTASGIRTGVKVEHENSTRKLEIYAKPCSPFTFELTFWDDNGDYYVLKLNDSLPIKSKLDMDDFMAMGELASYVKEHGHKFIA